MKDENVLGNLGVECWDRAHRGISFHYIVLVLVGVKHSQSNQFDLETWRHILRTTESS